jgi:ABC transporter with metal-binding/Fe-S-binding domain ATP-binding protein
MPSFDTINVYVFKDIPIMMNVAILFSGGKDSTYAAYLAKEHGHNISVLITLVSENPESYMFHTPSISKVEKQAEVMDIPLIIQKTKGRKEEELKDLECAMQRAKDEFEIKGIVTGTVESAYQASRIQKICDNLTLDCFNPLWQKNQLELLDDLVKDHFEIIITGVFAYPLSKEWLGRTINTKFIDEVTILNKKYQINPGGEGGEFESFVLNCPLFSRKLEINEKKTSGKHNSWTMEIEVA